MKTEDKKMIYDHLVLTTGNHLPIHILDDVCAGMYEKRKDGMGLFQILYDLERNKSLNKYKKAKDGAFYVPAKKDAGGSVNQLNMDGSLVATYKSIYEAAKFGLGSIEKKKGIRNAANGKLKYSAGYKWEWVDNCPPSLF